MSVSRYNWSFFGNEVGRRPESFQTRDPWIVYSFRSPGSWNVSVTRFVDDNIMPDEVIWTFVVAQTKVAGLNFTSPHSDDLKGGDEVVIGASIKEGTDVVFMLSIRSLEDDFMFSVQHRQLIRVPYTFSSNVVYNVTVTASNKVSSLTATRSLNAEVPTVALNLYDMLTTGAPNYACGPITLNSNTAQVSPASSTTYAYGTNVTLSCSAGYVPVNGSSGTGVCNDSGQWYWGNTGVTQQLQCFKGCWAIIPGNNSYQVSPANATTYANGTTVTLACSAGYAQNTTTATAALCTIQNSSASWYWNNGGTQLSCGKACGPVTLKSNSTQVSPPAASMYISGTKANLSCSSGSTPVSGTSGSGVCNSSGQWSWGDTGISQQLQCIKGCGPISLNSNSTQVSPAVALAYAYGTKATLNCSAATMPMIGTSSSGLCNGNGQWSWGDTATVQQLECFKGCPAIPLNNNTFQVSPPSAAAYARGTVATLACSASYVQDSATTSTGVCTTAAEGSIWSWFSGAKQLSCSLGCSGIRPNNNSYQVSPASAAAYSDGTITTLSCSNGYAQDPGTESTAACVVRNASASWSWYNGTTQLSCSKVFSPLFPESTASFFEPGTCGNCVLRPATTDDTCMLSCTYDSYCNGYALTSGGCYHNRPDLPTNVTSMVCQIRHI